MNKDSIYKIERKFDLLLVLIYYPIVLISIESPVFPIWSNKKLDYNFRIQTFADFLSMLLTDYSVSYSLSYFPEIRRRTSILFRKSKLVEFIHRERYVLLIRSYLLILVRLEIHRCKVKHQLERNSYL